MTEFETTTTARKVHIQEETTQALARERDLWQRDKEDRATMAEREHSQLQSELAMLHGYTMILMGELRAAHYSTSVGPSFLYSSLGICQLL